MAPRCPAAFLVLATIACLAPAAPPAVAPPDAWHTAAADARVLTENDAAAGERRALALLASLRPGAPASDRVLALNLVSRAEVYLARVDEARQHAEAALDAATRAGDRVGEAQASLNLILVAINQGRIDALRPATNRALTALDGVDRPDLMGEALLRESMLYRRNGRLEDSVTIAMQAMAIARQNSDPFALAYAEQGLALAFAQTQQYEQALEHFGRMRDLAGDAGSALLAADATLGLANARAGRGELDAAEGLLREAIEAYRRIGMPFSINQASFALANLLRQRGRLDLCIGVLTDIVERYGQYPNPLGLWYALEARSADYLTLKRLAEAGADAQRALDIARRIGSSQYLAQSDRRLAAIAAAQGDTARAYALSVQAADLTEKAGNEITSDRMVELAQRYEQEEKQRKIEELTRRGDQQRAQLVERDLERRWLATVLGAVLVALAGSAVFVRNLRRSQRRLRELNEQLQRSENDVRSLNAGLEQRVAAATQESRQQARYLRTLIDMLPMWAWFKDTRSRYLVVNQAKAAADGRGVNEIVGKSDAELLPPEVARAQLAEDAAVVAARGRKTSEQRVELDGGAAWMEFYRAAVVDDDGTVLGTVGVARDIDERKAAEAAREAALAEARALARQRSDFLARMSHELRTPLNGILGFAQLLRRGAGLGDAQARGLKIIEESGRHLLTLINDILDLSRIDANRLELAPATISLPNFLALVCDIVRVKAEEKGLAFEFEAAPDLPPMVRVDEKRLRQVLLNLLSNAVKFTDAGRVTLCVEAPAVAAQTPARGGARLRFEVRDTGLGLSEAQSARLFEPFEQLGAADRREGGSGLGLAISRQLIRLMGGDIQVRSRPGEGSIFAFEIHVPTESLGSAAPMPLRLPTGYVGERRRVLVADDVDHNRAMLREVLESLGFEVTEARDGAEALDEAERFRPQLAVIDLMMPVVDGFETLRRLRGTPAFRSLALIATSASATAEMEQRSRSAGSNVFIAKPIETAHLVDAVGTLLCLEWTYPAADPPPAAPAAA